MDRALPGSLTRIGDALTVDFFNGTDDRNSTEAPFFPESRDLLGGRELPIGNDRMWPTPILGEPPMENRSIFNQPQFELYDNEKGFFYYFFNVLCVLSILFAIVMNSVLLELLRRRWRFLIRRPFFFLLFVFCLVNLVSALCSVVTEVPVVTFLSSSSPTNSSSEISDYTFTTLYTVFYNLKLVCEQMVQYLNFLIALLRLLVFVFPILEEKFFHYYMLYIHLIWTLIASIVLVSYMYAFSCYLRYEVMVGFVNFGCFELNDIDAAPVIWWYYTTTFFLPGIDFIFYVVILIKFLVVRKVARSRRMEITVFVQSVILFLSFEVSGLLTMYLFVYPNFDRSVIFVGRRIFDTVYTLASGLSPLFVLLTNTDLRKGIVRRPAITKPTRPTSSKISSTVNSMTSPL